MILRLCLKKNLLKKQSNLTQLGKFLFLKSANKAAIWRKTGISETRLSLLSNDPTTILTAQESYQIALALDVEPGELQKQLFAHITLNSKEKQDELGNKKLKNKA